MRTFFRFFGGDADQFAKIGPVMGETRSVGKKVFHGERPLAFGKHTRWEEPAEWVMQADEAFRDENHEKGCGGHGFGKGGQIKEGR